MNPHYPPPMYLGGSVIGHGTLRRPREYEHTPPRILSKIDADQQYYYGWHPMNQKEPAIVDEQTTITLCPPGRTYCF